MVFDMVGIIRQLVQQSVLTAGAVTHTLMARRRVEGAVAQHIGQSAEVPLNILVEDTDALVRTLTLPCLMVSKTKVAHVIHLGDAHLAVLTPQPCLAFICQLLLCHSPL